MIDLDPRKLSYESSTFYCWAEDPRDASMHEEVFSMSVNKDMFDYFSQPQGRIKPASFLAIYCLDPLGNDDCPVGLCPNPDIAGRLLRIAHYVSAFCLTILIFHAPKRVKDAFYYQMSTIYAILITCCVSLFQANITRLHASVAIFIASSPVSIYFLVYSVRAFWGEHRLDTVLGKRNYLNRGMVFLATGIWIAIVIYTSLKSTLNRFAQASCKTLTAQEVFALQGWEAGPSIIISAIAALSWIVSIVLARKEIWPPGERYRPKFVTVWKTIGRRFPFVFFMSIGIAPMSLWIWATEWSLEPTQPSSSDINDNELSFSFGQILALFIAVPPFLQVCQLVPQTWTWIINLTWIACCWRRKRRGGQSMPIGKPDPSNEQLYSTDLEDPMLPEGGDDQPHGEMEEVQESDTRLKPNRYYGP